MKTLFASAYLALVPLTLAVAPAGALADEVQAPEVSLAEMKTIVSTKAATIIDANGTAMYNGAHVPGAVSFAKHEKNLANVLPKDKGALIVAYCGGPLCTAWQDAAKAAKQMGYTNVKHFKGGIKGWTTAGEKVEKS